jgi:hypothetical protein
MPDGQLQSRIRAAGAQFSRRDTAANLAGMGRVMSFKNSMMLTAPRIFGLITLLAPRCGSNGLGSGGNCFLADIERDSPIFSGTVRRVVIMSVGSRRNRTRRR